MRADADRLLADELAPASIRDTICSNGPGCRDSLCLSHDSCEQEIETLSRAAVFAHRGRAIGCNDVARNGGRAGLRSDDDHQSDPRTDGHQRLDYWIRLGRAATPLLLRFSV